jgi:hypothetical protein
VKFFRLHSTRRYAVLSLLLGFTFYLWKPVCAKENQNEFSNWLESFVKNQDARQLHEKLDRLSRHSGDMDEMLDEAAGIIHAHTDDFDLPFSNDADKETDLKQQLINSWHQQQKQGGMSAAFFTEASKVHSIHTKDFSTLNGTQVSAFQKSLQSAFEKRSDRWLYTTFNNLSPLESGIAIGAP